MNIPALVRVALVCAAALLSAGARAELGGDRASVEHDAVAFRGSRLVAAQGLFERHEIVRADGSRLREYVSPKGQVFAVAWDGATTPDLKTLLGSHYAEYVAALSTQRPSHHVVNVATPGLVASVTRFQHNGTGRVHLPAQVPAGIASEDLR
jgi:hypothetical protein